MNFNLTQTRFLLLSTHAYFSNQRNLIGSQSSNLHVANSDLTVVLFLLLMHLYVFMFESG